MFWILVDGSQIFHFSGQGQKAENYPGSPMNNRHSTATRFALEMKKKNVTALFLAKIKFANEHGWKTADFRDVLLL